MTSSFYILSKSFLIKRLHSKQKIIRLTVNHKVTSWGDENFPTCPLSGRLYMFVRRNVWLFSFILSVRWYSYNLLYGYFEWDYTLLSHVMNLYQNRNCIPWNQIIQHHVCMLYYSSSNTSYSNYSIKCIWRCFVILFKFIGTKIELRFYLLCLKFVVRRLRSNNQSNNVKTNDN